MLIAGTSGYMGHHSCGPTAAGRQTSLPPAEDSASAGGPPHAGPFGPDLLRLTYSNQPPASAGASREGTPDTAQLASRSGLLQGGAQHARNRARNDGGCVVEKGLYPPVGTCPAPCHDVTHRLCLAAAAEVLRLAPGTSRGLYMSRSACLGGVHRACGRDSELQHGARRCRVCWLCRGLPALSRANHAQHRAQTAGACTLTRRACERHALRTSGGPACVQRCHLLLPFQRCLPCPEQAGMRTCRPTPPPAPSTRQIRRGRQREGTGCTCASPLS